MPSPLLPPPDDGLPLLDTSGLRRLEREASAGLAPGTLMERAGLAAAQLARALWPGRRRICVLVGPGNNGGDGLVAARWLAAQGCEISLLQPQAARQPSAERRAAEAHAHGLPRAEELPAEAELIIDALLGIGLHEAPREPLAGLIRAANQHPAPCLALDLPSGLDADSGHAPGAVIEADDTLSLLAPCPGLLTGRGRQVGGRLWLDALGASRPLQASTLATGSWNDWRRHAPRARLVHSGHKGSAGRVWVLQGEAQMAGAARLAARAALAAGAGRVYVVGQGAVDADPLWPELMRPPLEAAWEELTSSVAVIGCGGGQRIGEQLQPWLTCAQTAVIDADALNAIANAEPLQQQLRERAARGLVSVLTPHPLEAARLLGLPGASAVQAERLRHAQALAERFACTVLLKGSGSVIAAPGELPLINTTGHAALSTAGTGDVLAGWLAGLLAQAPQVPARELLRMATAWHGAAAETLPRGGAPLLASALIEAMQRLHP